ncbi:hypothetical protein EDD85DRAFT_1027700 [Armillaria nabsnona]|nr:hypothetical protein EDD85DRAFT_1027700 [Armillaria nabsnona]
MSDWDDEENDWDDDEENDLDDEEASDSDDDGKKSPSLPSLRRAKKNHQLSFQSNEHIPGLLNQLNTALGTSYSLDNPFLSSLLDDCITNRYDFGMAYNHLRRIWHTDNWSTVRDELSRREEEDREMRQKAIIGNRIVETWLPPRRVWDLYSNRVVPYWIKNLHSNGLWPRPISHAWMDEKDRTAMWTPINGCEWPVPVPKDADLNLIRIEMLNLGAEYAWLDVLCLRQVGRQREDMRIEEWKLDVPTIGRVYQHVHVEGDLESDRSWFRRAWTLQEVGKTRMIAGDTPDGPLHAKRKDGNFKFHKQLQSSHDTSWNMREALEEMRNRVSTNPVDKIAGLAFLMGSDMIPAYYKSESLEQAWTALVNVMDTECRTPLFFLCPEPGNAGKKWRPSWDQVMTKPLPTHPIVFPTREIDRNETRDEDWCNAEGIEGSVLGLAEGDQRGVLIVKDKGGIEHRFGIIATHTSPIPEDTYTMIYTCHSLWYHGWVVGRSLPGGKFEKVSMLEISDKEHQRLKNLGITERRQHILI